MPSSTLSAVSPPERIIGTFERRRPARLQSQERPEPPRIPSTAVSSRWKSVRKRSSDCRSAAPSTRAALITLAPVLRAVSVAKDGPSSPCSCTWVSPIASTAWETSSSVGFTNTPTSSTWRRTRRAIPAATGSSTARLEAGQRMKPSAHAPSDAASSASSSRVMPQILTRVTGSTLAQRHGGGALAQLDLHREVAAVAEQLHRDPVAGPVARDHVVDVGPRAPGPAVEGEDHVTAGHAAVAEDPGARRRAVQVDLADAHAGPARAERDERLRLVADPDPEIG